MEIEKLSQTNCQVKLRNRCNHVFRSTGEYLQKEVKPVEIAVLITVVVVPSHKLAESVFQYNL
jgi:hypothetical protein